MGIVTTTNHWEHSHQCRRCGHAMRIEDIEPKVIAAGVITCPKCDLSGPINVVILNAKELPDQRESLNKGNDI